MPRIEIDSLNDRRDTIKALYYDPISWLYCPQSGKDIPVNEPKNNEVKLDPLISISIKPVLKLNQLRNLFTGMIL